MSARCDRCKRIFSHNDALMQHYLNASIHNYCKRCKRDFGTPVALEEHQKKSSSHNFCDQCGNDYFQTSDLMEHIEECHWYCAKCKLFVETGSLLQKHYEKSSAHHYCGPCKMEFNSAGHLNTHLRSASYVNPDVECPGCTAQFPSISSMVIHMESGTCASGATRRMVNDNVRRWDPYHLVTEYFSTHANVDTEKEEDEEVAATWQPAMRNDYAHQCCFCHRKFRNLLALTQHLNSPVHQPKIYNCPACTTRFTVFSGLVQHVESDSCGISRLPEVKRAFDYITYKLSHI